MAEGQGSVALAGDAVGSVIVTGSGNTVRLDLGGIDGDLLSLLLKRGQETPTKRPRPPPVRVRPPPHPDHLDRDDEAATILGRAGPGAPVNVYGEEGIGKTFLLTHVANQPGADRFPGGVVHLSGRELARPDLLQRLFERLFECQPPTVQSEGQTEIDLQDREALVVIDDFELERDEAQRLFAAAPRCSFVVASRSRTVWEGTALKLGGLGPADSLAMFERELGPLVGHEQAAAEAVAAALGHNALALRQAASVSRDEAIPLAELAGWLAGAPSPHAALLDRVLNVVDPEERTLLETLAPFGSAPVGTEHLDALTGVAEDALARLERRRLVGAHSPRYSLRGVSAADIEQRWADAAPALAEHSLQHFAEWAAARRRDLAGLLDQSEALLALQRWAARHGRPADVISLGRQLSATLAWDRRWGRWRDVLESVLESARQLQDRRQEAWALHQLGTRAAALGALPEGVALLREALAIREESGSSSETALTRHNLDVALRLGAPPAGGFPHLPAVLVGVLLVAVVGLAIAYVALRPDSVTVAVATSGRGTVTSDPAGIDCGATCTVDVREGTRVTLTATAQRGQAFVGWQGGGCSGTRPCTITVERDTSTRAVFDATIAPTRLLTVSRVGPGGTVTSAPSGIDCGRSCAASFADGARVTLSASATKGSVFAGWRGAGCSGTGACTMTLRRDGEVEARFESATRSHVLDVETSGMGGGVTSEPSGIDCGRSCRGSFPDGTRVTLTPAADQGAAFVGWEGDCSGTGPCAVNMTEDRSVTATFSAVRTLTVEVIEGPGTVTSKPSGIDCGKTCSAPYDQGTRVTLTATGDLRGWAGPCQGRRPDLSEEPPTTCVVDLTDDVKVTAAFRPVIR